MNMSNNPHDPLNAKKLVSFLQQLICPPVKNSKNISATTSKKPNQDQDTCELVAAIPRKRIYIGQTDPEGRGMKSLGVFTGTLNDHLHDAARNGLVTEVDRALEKGADMCYQKNGQTPYHVALQTANEYHNRLQSQHVTFDDHQQLREKMQWCQHIAHILAQSALPKLIEAIERSDTGMMVAYHMAGAPLTTDLIYRACSSSDNVEIVHYLIGQSTKMFQSLYTFTRPESPYQTAIKNKFYQVASYIKYRLSVECSRAVKENNLPYMKQLVLGGASVDMLDTNHLQQAFEHQNIELIQFLCDYGAKIPKQWLESPNIILSDDVTQTMSSKMVVCVNQCLVNRRLRFAAACGDLSSMIQCQRLGANIDSMNCYGSTAVLCRGGIFTLLFIYVNIVK